MKIQKIISTVVLFVLLNVHPCAKSQNNCLDFDGIDDDITLVYNPKLDFSLSNEFTIELWFKTTNYIATFYSNMVDISPFTGHEVGIYHGKVFFGLCNDHITSSLRIETSTAYNDGNWHHVACVYYGNPNANTVKMYIDGLLYPHLVTHNNLSTPFNSGNAHHIGARNSTTYHVFGSIDELRVWGKALCGDEIVARKNCHLVGNEPNLLAYYPFNQGVPLNNNAVINSLTDASGNNNTATLNNFGLNGGTSNWINAGNGITGTCSAFTLPLLINGSSTSCLGNKVTLTASGASNYTWQPGNVQGQQLSVSPTLTTTYTITAINQNGCKGTSFRTQSVSICTGIDEQSLNEKEENLLFPNPFTSKLTLSNTQGFVMTKVWNSLGQLILKTELSDSTNNFDLTPYENGVYFFQLYKDDNSFITRKVVKH